jgi:hypothetical protein
MARPTRGIDPRYGASSGASWAHEQWVRSWHASGGRVGSQAGEAEISMKSPAPSLSPLELEQAYLTQAYRLMESMAGRGDSLDLARADATIRALAERSTAERVALLRRLLERDEQLPLLLGRLDLNDGPLYVGRAMVVDEERNLKIASWRAPAAAAFYRASRRQPENALRRRRIRADGRTVVEVTDEALVDPLPERLQKDLAPPLEIDPIVAALSQRRGARMVDVVSTLMPDQYELVAAPLSTTLVVQGSPGSGKTAVGLHRAAFLLYGDDGDQSLQPSEMLVVGPNPLFLDYTHDVLPDLGEAEIEQTTLQGLLPVSVDREEPDPARDHLLGEERMAGALHDFLWSLPKRPEPESLDIDGVQLSSLHLRIGFDAAMRQRGGYLDRREAFVHAITRHYGKLVQPSRLRTVISSRFWPSYGPERAVRTFLSSPGELVGTCLTASDASSMSRTDPERWTRAEAVLVDEASAILHGRQDRRFTHLVVDEIQDLSPMELRAIGRRARQVASFTILGDLAQSTRSGAPVDWREIVRLLGTSGPTRRVDLRMAYRVPEAALAPALALYEDLDVKAPAPLPYRSGGGGFHLQRASNGADLAERVSLSVQDALEWGGSVGVIAPHAELDAVVTLLREQEMLRGGSTALDGRLTVIPDSQTHGLEFDHVVVVEPSYIADDDGARGLRRLYVALTRATNSLTIVHLDPLPAGLGRWARDHAPISHS